MQDETIFACPVGERRLLVTAPKEFSDPQVMAAIITGRRDEDIFLLPEETLIEMAKAIIMAKAPHWFIKVKNCHHCGRELFGFGRFCSMDCMRSYYKEEVKNANNG